MGDIYHADQGEDETVTSFATGIEGLLPYVRDKFPNKIPLAKDFYHADQGEDETITSFATGIEGLLSYVRDKFPNQIPLAKEQQLLKER